jgi:acetolactate decarboxylase
MKRRTCLWSVAILVSLAALGCESEPSLVQVGSLQELAKGEYDGIVKLSELPADGQWGLGTYDALDGEMVMLDDVYYRVPVKGKVTIVKPVETTPFCNVATGTPTKAVAMKSFASMAELKARLLELVPDKDQPCGFRIDGPFAKIITRSVPIQSKPYKPLLAVVKNEQVVFDLTKKKDDVRGTIMGFYFPKSMKGLNIVGFHLHFITDDRKAGGHLLDAANLMCSMPSAGVQVRVLPLPKTTWVGPKPAAAANVSSADLDFIEKHPTGK